MKEIYQKPKIEVIHFEKNNDFLTCSGEYHYEPVTPPHPGPGPINPPHPGPGPHPGHGPHHP